MWLLEQSIKEKIEHAEKTAIFTSEQIETFTAPRLVAKGTSRITTESGVINVKGVLTNEPDIFAMWFGGGNTTYPEIVNAISLADNNNNIEDITMKIDSPGGNFSGLFSVIDAMNEAKKPITAIISNLGASAAYGIASQANKIIAENKSALVGSVGVATSYYTSDDVVDLASTAAPKKRPDPKTEEGKKIIVEGLDDIHELFAGTIATGRGKTTKQVNKDFGQGATLLAEEALSRGMIDAIGNTNKEPSKSEGKNLKEAKSMDLKELRSEQPDLYAEVFNLGKSEGEGKGLESGKTAESERAGLHLAMGKKVGNMDLAQEGFDSGEGMTAAWQEKYLEAALNKTDIDQRNSDDEETRRAANVSAEEKDLTDQTMEILEEKHGKVAI